MAGIGSHGAISLRTNQLTVLVSVPDEDVQAFHRIVGPRHRVISTRDVAEARDVITKYGPQIVICDSDTRGAESWRDLLAITGCQTFALIVVSRNANAELWAEVLNLGGHDVLARPFLRREVEWTISSALRRASAK